MQVAAIPQFECRELRSIITQCNKKGKMLFKGVSQAQHMTARIVHKLALVMLACSVPLTVYGIFTFSAAPIISAVGLCAVASAVMFLGYRCGLFNSFVYKSLKDLKFDTPSNNGTFYWKMAADLMGAYIKIYSLSPSLDFEVKTLLVTYQTYAYMQAALNEFRNIVYETDEAKAALKKEIKDLDIVPLTLKKSTQALLFAPKMKEAAIKAYNLLETNKHIFNGNNDVGFVEAHRDVVELLSSYNHELVKNYGTRFEKANILGIALATGNYSLGLVNLPESVPMVAYTNSEGILVKGLNSYLQDRIQRLMDATKAS